MIFFRAVITIKLRLAKSQDGRKSLFYCGQNLIMGRHTAHNLSTPWPDLAVNLPSSRGPPGVSVHTVRTSVINEDAINYLCAN